MDSLTALLMLKENRARATWGDGYVLVETRVKDPGASDCWDPAAREATFVHAVMSARDKLGWKLTDGGKA